MCVTVASVVFCTRIAANPQRLLRLLQKSCTKNTTSGNQGRARHQLTQTNNSQNQRLP